MATAGDSHRSGPLHNVGEHRLMTDVNAVEITNAQDRTAGRIIVAKGISENLHATSAHHRETDSRGLAGPHDPTIRPTRSYGWASSISTSTSEPAGAVPSLISNRPSISGACRLQPSLEQQLHFRQRPGHECLSGLPDQLRCSSASAISCCTANSSSRRCCLQASGTGSPSSAPGFSSCHE